VAQKPTKSLTADQPTIHLVRDWLKEKEPDWFLDLKPVGTVGYAKSVYYTLSVGVVRQWIGWIDGPYAGDDCQLALWGFGAGYKIIDLREPDSFNKIHEFLKERIQHAV
jgi:hypothetical protein